MRFSRFAVATAIMLSLSGCGSTDTVTNMETSASPIPVETTVPQPTPSEGTTESVRYYISDERRSVFRHALLNTGQKLFEKIIDGGIPYRLQSLDTPTYLEQTEETTVPTGWALLTTKPPSNPLNADARISMRVFVVDGQVDRSQTPLTVYISSRGNQLEIRGETEFSNGAPLRNYPTAFTWSWTNSLDDQTMVIPWSHEGQSIDDPFATETWDVNLYDDQHTGPAPVDVIKKVEETFVRDTLPAFLNIVDGSDWK